MASRAKLPSPSASGALATAFLLLLAQIVTVALAIIFAYVAPKELTSSLSDPNYFLWNLALVLSIALTISIATDWIEFRLIHELQVYRISLSVADICMLLLYYTINSFVALMVGVSLTSGNMQNDIIDSLYKSDAVMAKEAATAYILFSIYWILCFFWNKTYINTVDSEFNTQIGEDSWYWLTAIGAAICTFFLAIFNLYFFSSTNGKIGLVAFAGICVVAEAAWIRDIKKLEKETSEKKASQSSEGKPTAAPPAKNASRPKRGKTKAKTARR